MITGLERRKQEKTSLVATDPHTYFEHLMTDPCVPILPSLAHRSTPSSDRNNDTAINAAGLPKSVPRDVIDEGLMLVLLKQARFTADAQSLYRKKSLTHKGDDLVAKVRCEMGHSMEWTIKTLQEAIANPLFNDPSIVPCLCQQCAYPGHEHVRNKKETVYHRLAILRKRYPDAAYLSGFSLAGCDVESYTCGMKFSDGQAHPAFTIRHDKFSAANKHGKPEHMCYVCGIAENAPAEIKIKTLPMLAGRMQWLADQIQQRCKRTAAAPTVHLAERTDEPLSMSKTSLVFSCNQPEHPSIVETANHYFGAAKGGYCRRCLEDAGVRSTAELHQKV